MNFTLPPAARLCGRPKCGGRCDFPVPHGHCKSTTVVAAMSGDGIIAYRILESPMNAERFRAFLSDLAGKLLPGDIPICDNLSAHKAAGVNDMARSAEACICHVPLYSPEFNPIEKAISQTRSHLRKVAPGDRKELDAAIEGQYSW